MRWLSPIKLAPTESSRQEVAEAIVGPDQGHESPQQAVPEYTGAFFRGIARTLHQMADEVEDSEQPGDIDPPSRAVRRARMIAGVLSSSADEGVERVDQRLRALEESEDSDEDDDLEEGEIREGVHFDDEVSDDDDSDPDPHNLATFQIFDRESFYGDFTLENRASTAPGHHCPLCRQVAFFESDRCHADTIQLIRVRLRLSDLAYKVFGFERTPEESKERDDILHFLNRRYKDNLALGEQEILPSPAKCAKVFRLAREQLRGLCYKYTGTYALLAKEQLRVVQLAMFYENIRLLNHRMPSFFDPVPKSVDDIDNWAIQLTAEDFLAAYKNPEDFFGGMKMDKGAKDPTIEDENDTEAETEIDEDMADAMSTDHEDADSVG
ncbi:MAG: hypothetical protein Q9219_001399 [cf. Caloplaca sp. 3 TL-2023]